MCFGTVCLRYAKKRSEENQTEKREIIMIRVMTIEDYDGVYALWKK